MKFEDFSKVALGWSRVIWLFLLGFILGLVAAAILPPYLYRNADPYECLRTDSVLGSAVVDGLLLLIADPSRGTPFRIHGWKFFGMLLLFYVFAAAGFTFLPLAAHPLKSAYVIVTWFGVPVLAWFAASASTKKAELS